MSSSSFSQQSCQEHFLMLDLTYLSRIKLAVSDSVFCCFALKKPGFHLVHHLKDNINKHITYLCFIFQCFYRLKNAWFHFDTKAEILTGLHEDSAFAAFQPAALNSL